MNACAHRPRACAWAASVALAFVVVAAFPLAETAHAAPYSRARLTRIVKKQRRAIIKLTARVGQLNGALDDQGSLIAALQQTLQQQAGQIADLQARADQQDALIADLQKTTQQQAASRWLSGR